MTFAYRPAIVALGFAALAASPVSATEAKLDAETCNQLRLEHMKFVESGTAADMQKGAEWARANLAPDKLRDVELFIQLDEQINFGCRDAKLTLDAVRAAEAAKRLELNPDLDPTAPVPADVGGTGDSDGDGVADAPVSKPKAKPKPKAEPKAEHKAQDNSAKDSSAKDSGSNDTSPKNGGAAKAVSGGAASQSAQTGNPTSGTAKVLP